MRAVVVGLVLVGVAVAALWVGGGAIRRTVRVCVWVTGVIVFYLAVTFFQVWWESNRDDQSVSSAIVVLGAAQYDGRPSPVLRARLDHAAYLYRQGAAPMVIVTGSKQVGDRVGEGYAGYDYLRDEGIPEAALKIESTGRDTYEELSATGHILDSDGVARNVIVVSSRYHAHRAKAIAEEVGLEARFSGVPTDQSTMEELTRETAAVSAGRLISYRRLSNLQ